MLINTPATATATATVEERREPGWDHREWRVGGLPPPPYKSCCSERGVCSEEAEQGGFPESRQHQPCQPAALHLVFLRFAFFFFFFKSFVLLLALLEM